MPRLSPRQLTPAPRLFAAALAALLGSASGGSAQSAEHPTNRFDLGAGAFWMARRDETISPMRYAGTGWQSALAWSRQSTSQSIAARIDGGTAILAPDALPSSQRIWRANADIAFARAIPAARAVHAGIALRGSLLVTRQHFPSAAVAVPTFRFSSITIAPVIATSTRLARGTTRLRIGVPLAGVVDRPYSAVKSGATRLAPAPVSAASLRGIDVGATWSTDATRSASVSVGYDASYTLGTRHGTMRTLVHGATIGVARSGRRSASR